MGKLNLNTFEDVKVFFDTYVKQMGKYPNADVCKKLLIGGEKRVRQLCGAGDYFHLAVEKLGYQPTKKPYTEEKVHEVVGYIREYVDEKKSKRSANDFTQWMKKRYGFSCTPWKNPQGLTWNQLLELAQATMRKPVYDREEVRKMVTSFVTSYVELNGFAPSQQDVSNQMKMDRATILRAFDKESFEDVIRLLGHTPSFQNFSDEDKKNALFKVKEEENRYPRRSDFFIKGFFKDGTRKPQLSVFYQNGKTFNDWLKEVNFPYRERGGHGHSYLSNHGHQHRSEIQGVVDDLFYYYPNHEHDYSYHVLGRNTGAFITNSKKDMDFFLILHGNYIVIEVTGYYTRRQYEMNLPLEGEAKKHASRLREKEKWLKKAKEKVNLHYYFIFVDDDPREILKDVICHFESPTECGRLIDESVPPRKNNPFIYFEEDLVQAIQKTFEITNQTPTEGSVYRHTGISSTVFNHARYKERNWQDWLLLADIPSVPSRKQVIISEVFKEVKDYFIENGCYPTTVEKGKLHKKVYYHLNKTWQEFITSLENGEFDDYAQIR